MENENLYDDKLYSTRDLYFAATLLTLKFNLDSIDYQVEGVRNQPVGYFNFENTPQLQEVEKKYWGRQLAVEPLLYTANLRSLKAQVSNVYKGPRVNMEKFKKNSE